jgi:putative endonuclease
MNAMARTYNFWVYITTNPRKSTFYAGMTNNLSRRLVEHYQNRGKQECFAGKYYCYNLVYFEWHQYVLNAISREKLIKEMTRVQKEELISEINPSWKFLNEFVCGIWPPNDELLINLGKEQTNKERKE